ncbi:hypothetical protein [Dysgonomonas sp. ZJ709]|uniref:hypothetical protein n=1 Tax=Dysgonomonas sp. ZJ709 TaxID=2709797 RepID=UPI0013EBD44B|nr:hypothetical protein [Dysgonomonas sp. ZJ709]
MNDIINFFFSRKYLMVLAYFILFTLIILFIWYNKKDAIEREENYTLIREYINLPIEGIVSKKEASIGMFDRGSCYVDLSSGIKLNLFGGPWNFLYDEPSMESLLEVGDSISKKANTDTIYVYKSDRKFYFVLGKLINEDKRN